MADLHEDSGLRFTHSLRAIAVVGVLAAIVTWGALTILPFELLKKGSFVFLPLMLAPFAVFSNVLSNFNSITDMKELSFKERERLEHIINYRHFYVKRSLVIYFFAALIACLFIYFGQGDVISIPAASITCGVCIAGFYSSIVALNEGREISQFKSKIIGKANAKAKMEAIQKKVGAAASK